MEKKLCANLSLLTACTLCATILLSACTADTTDPAGDTLTNETDTALQSSEDTTKAYRDAIPEDVFYNDKAFRIRINEFDQTQHSSELFMIGSEEETGDVLMDEIYRRNQAVEERLGVAFEYEIVSYQWNGVVTPTRQLIMSGDDTYDLIVDQQSSLLQLANEKMFLNFYDYDINDFSQNYWWDDYMNELQVSKDSRFIVAGDYFLDVAEVSSAVFFNKSLFEEHYGKEVNLYDIALDGDWTLAMLGTYIKDFYSDVNGNTVADDGDLFSMNLSRNSMDAICFGSGIDFIQRDKDGYPTLNLNDEKISNMVQQVNENLFTPKTTYDFSKEKYNGANAGSEEQYYLNQRDAFASGKLLFLNDYLAAVKNLRDMEDDYGILPIPKYDATESAYHSISHDTALVGVIPVTCQNPEMVCNVVEALCSMSHDTTITSYFETALKVKYARDEESAKIIDLLHDSISTSFCYAMTVQFEYYEIFRKLFDARSANYASEYAKIETSVAQKLDTMIEGYKSK